MPYLIDAHQDLAYNAKTFGRDIRRSAYETRRLEMDSEAAKVNGHTLLGWPEYQRGQVAVVFASLFVMPRSRKTAAFENQVYSDYAGARRLAQAQFETYLRLCEEPDGHFILIRDRRDLARALQPWQQGPQDALRASRPVGLVLTIEGAEGLAGMDELEEWWQAGVRMIGPVWAGGRYCGSVEAPGRFTPEGLRLLDSMAESGYTLDIAHMSEESALQVCDYYPGAIIASHANAAALLSGDAAARHLSDRLLKRLAERGGVVGVMPFNRFLLPAWQNSDQRELVTLRKLIDHIDHICQVTGTAEAVGIGTDFDGGFGWPAVPLEIDTIADLQKLVPLLETNGYGQAEIEAIFHGNWQRILERTLPA